MNRVGIIGCGTVGRTFAARLLQGGVVPLVFDREPQKADPIVQAGGERAAGRSQLARSVDCLVSCLPRPEDVLEQFLSDDGLLAAMNPRSMVLECSTVGPECVRTVAAEAAGRKIRYLDTPLSRGKATGNRGTVTLLVGGNADHFDLARPLLEILADRLLYCGGVGQAQVAKLINNLVAHSVTVASGQALALGLKSGLPLDLLCSVLHQGTGQNRVVDEILPGTLFLGDCTPGHRIDMVIKELEEAGRLAEQEGVTQTLLEPVLDLFRIACQRGWDRLGAPAVLQVVEEEAGVRLRSETISGG